VSRAPGAVQQKMNPGKVLREISGGVGFLEKAAVLNVIFFVFPVILAGVRPLGAHVRFNQFKREF